MRNCVSLLLLLAIAVSIGNAQVQPRQPPANRQAPPAAGGSAGRQQPQKPGSPPAAGTPPRSSPPQRQGPPNSQNVPNRQQGPPQQPGNPQPRATRAPGSVSSAPLRPNPQQSKLKWKSCEKF